MVEKLKAPAGQPVPAAPQPFSFEIIQKLAPHSYLYGHLNPTPPSKPIRPNGRQLLEHRKPLIHVGSLNHTNGSAIVRQGGTAALCGIRAEILNVDDIPNWRPDRYQRQSKQADRNDGNVIEELGLLVPNVELRTGCTWDNLPDRPMSDAAQTLSSKLMTSLLATGVIDLEKLVIRSKQEEPDLPGDDEDPIKAFWTLYIDVLLISLDGNPFDAVWTACMAALRNTTVPRAEWEEEYQMVMCDENIAAAVSLYSGIPPMHSTYVVFKSNMRNTDIVNKEGKLARRTGDGQEYWVLADPDSTEAELCNDQVSVLQGPKMNEKSHQLFHVEKVGGVTISMVELKEIIQHAEGRWSEWTELFEGLAKPG